MSLPALHDRLVSIVVCNYNGARFLEAALRSALAQARRCQVICVDDGSTDGSREVLARWSDRIDVVLQANGGQIAAYETGVERCRGEVVIFLDSDDVLLPHAASAAAAAFGAGIAKVHWRMQLIDECGVLLGPAIPATLTRGEVLPALERDGLLYASAPGSGNAYRRSVLERLMPMPPDPLDRHGADFFAIYGSAAFGRVAAIDEPLGQYRVQGAARGLSMGNAARTLDEATRHARRASRFAPWIAQRTAGLVRVPDVLLDFSIEKTAFAKAVLGRPYAAGVRAGWRRLPPLVRSLWLQRSYPLGKRIALSLWACAVLVAPRRAGAPLARYVCNPSQRGSPLFPLGRG